MLLAQTDAKVCTFGWELQDDNSGLEAVEIPLMVRSWTCIYLANKGRMYVGV